MDIYNAVAQKSTNLYLTQQKRNVIGNRIGALPLPDLTSAGADYLTWGKFLESLRSVQNYIN